VARLLRCDCAGSRCAPRVERAGWSGHARREMIAGRCRPFADGNGADGWRLARDELRHPTGSIVPGKRLGSPGDARPGRRRLPANALGWPQKIAPADAPCSASPAGPTSSPRCCPADRRFRIVHARWQPCPRETAGPCNRPTTDSFPARILAQHGKPTDGHREDLCEFLQAMLDPIFANFPEPHFQCTTAATCPDAPTKWETWRDLCN